MLLQTLVAASAGMAGGVRVARHLSDSARSVASQAALWVSPFAATAGSLSYSGRYDFQAFFDLLQRTGEIYNIVSGSVTLFDGAQAKK